MIVSILSESVYDEAALRPIVEALLGAPIELVGPPGLRGRGWPAVRTSLPTVVRELWYNSDAAGLVCVVDANGSHFDCSAGSAERLTEISSLVTETLADLRQQPRSCPLCVAVGLGMPSFDAWLVPPEQPEQSEAVWDAARRSRVTSRQYTMELRRKAYGGARKRGPDQVGDAERIGRAAAARASDLERLFPIGFGGLARSLREWSR